MVVLVVMMSSKMYIFCLKEIRKNRELVPEENAVSAK